ncbi:MAG TPA: rhomboid family intramembrane serine protease, partial [Candidatus Sulfotelmatobacter sp.]|nr:rhomboid family intramembrane serine protease [Candidatus Sulfotelmatobacter sp.]
MIPLRDNIPVRHTPLFTLAIIALNAYVFLQTFLLGAYGGERFIHYYGLIPCSLTGACRVVGRAFSSDLTVVTSMFVHAGFFHFA